MRTVAIVPVKRLATAKQRLADRLPTRSRVALVQAMLTDVLIALRRSTLVDLVIVVTGEETAEQIALNYGAEVLDDEVDAGHSAAAERGIALAMTRGAKRVLLVPGDTPALDPKEVDGLLASAPEGEREVTLVPDRHGDGTNALVLTPPDVIEPTFGPGSRARHTAAAQTAGAAVFVAEPVSLTLDIDTADDLAELEAHLGRTRGSASHSRGLLPRIL